MSNKLVFIALFAVFCQLSQQLAIGSGKGMPDYDGCGTKYYCYGLPDKCEDKKTCVALLKSEPQDQGVVDFKLFWVRAHDSKDSYVAAGLSTDNMMGDDSTTLLWIDANGTVNTAEGLTYLKKDSNGSEHGGFNQYNVGGIKMLKHQYKDGLLTAHWTREAKTSVNKETFDLKTTKYYLLLAYGPVVDSHIQHHSDQGASSMSYDLESDPSTTAPSSATKGTGTTSAPTTAAPTSAKPTGSTGKPASSTAAPTGSTAAPTGSSAAPTTGSSSETTGTGTTSNSTETGATSKAPTGKPTKPTSKPSTTKAPGSASTATMSIMLAIFASILVFFK